MSQNVFIDKIDKLFKKYNFDYIYINPIDIYNIDFEIDNDELFVDFKGKPNYLGYIKLENNIISVYWNKKITPGDVIFGYKNIKKERNVKLSNIFHNSIN